MNYKLKAIATLLSIYMLSACQNNTHKTEQTTQTAVQTEQATPSVNTTHSVKTPNFEGFWVNSLYLKEFQATLSPSKAAKKAEIVAISIKPDSLDKLEAGLVFNWHEGNGYKIKSLGGDKFQLTDPNTDNKKAFDLALTDGALKLNDTLAFTRMGNSADGENSLTDYLVGGTYTLKGTTNTVTFSKNKITGLSPYTVYSVLLDYVTEQGTIFDQIALSIKENARSEYFGFEKKGKNLTIFKLNCKTPKQDPCMSYSKGKVVYELIGQ